MVDSLAGAAVGAFGFAFLADSFDLAATSFCTAWVTMCADKPAASITSGGWPTAASYKAGQSSESSVSNFFS